MTDPDRDREIERLRRENEALDGQVKLLVQTEQRLYRSQGELDAQLTRIRELAGFALESIGLASSGDIFGRAADVLARTFALDWVGALALDPLERAVRRVDDPARAASSVACDGEAWAWLAGLREPVLASGPGPGEAAGRLLATLEPELAAAGPGIGRGILAAVPITGMEGRRWVLLAFAAHDRHPLPHFGDLAEHHLAFLQLLARHVERALENALLTESLRERSAQLATSLETLERTQRELLQAQKLEAVGRLAGGVAHDFNNLLTVILGYADLLASSLPEASPEHENIRRILDAAERAAGITGQLLALGRRQIQSRRDFDLNEKTAKTAELLERLVGEHIQLELSLEPGLGLVRADPSQVEQVMLNLFVNARDAMPDGGVLRLVTRRANAADAARCEPPADARAFVALEVEDSGVGMEDATRARIFEPFFTTKGAGQGSGLGLAVVYGIVKQSDGHVLVESSPGRGARFTVLLPLAGTSEAAPAAAASGGRAADGIRGRILVIEDEPGILEVVTAVLGAAGHDVITAANGEEALARLAAGRLPDLVLTDVVMPRLGGVRLADELSRRHPSLRIAFMSGYSEDLIGKDERSDRASFLAKPFTPAQLLRFVSARLAGAASARA